jgi:hypothetical protein
MSYVGTLAGNGVDNSITATSSLRLDDVPLNAGWMFTTLAAIA